MSYIHVQVYILVTVSYDILAIVCVNLLCVCVCLRACVRVCIRMYVIIIIIIIIIKLYFRHIYGLKCGMYVCARYLEMKHLYLYRLGLYGYSTECLL